MADVNDAVIAIQQYGGMFQPKFRHWLAYIGDGNGAVNTSDPNYCLVRYPLQSSPAVEVFNTKTVRVDNLRVIVGYTAQQPNLLQVIDVADQRLDQSVADGTVVVPGGPNGYTNLPQHAANHSYLGVDPIFINWRQITPLGVFPTSPASLSVQIRGGYIPRTGGAVYVSDQNVDLTSHVPGSGARYVLISYDSIGAVVVTDGTINSGGFSALTAADIPATPAGNWRSCGVVLYSGQTAIVETRGEIDFYDLRFPEEKSAGNIIPLTHNHIFVGNSSNVAADVAQSGDFSFSDTGVGTLSTSGVTAATYGDATHIAQITFDAKGRATTAANVAISLTAGHVIQDEGTPLTQRANLNFVGSGVTATDDSGNSASKVFVPIWEPVCDPTGSMLVDVNGNPVMAMT